MKKIYLVHCWDGTSDDGWYPWIAKELSSDNIELIKFDMPNRSSPIISEWVSMLDNKVDCLDENTYFIGHSIGCQTIMRYLETKNVSKIGGILFVAPWLDLLPEAINDEESYHIAKPWTTSPINFEKIKKVTDKITCIFSDDDYFVSLEQERKFRELLNAKTVVVKEKGHISAEDGVYELEEIYNELVEIITFNRRKTMTKIKMLGTGHGGVIDLYNTCFAIENETGVFLVDTGGSIEIIKRLKLSNIEFKKIKNIFISHSHTDHILGLIWMFKKLSLPILHGEIKEKINIYCNDVVCNSIKDISKAVLPGYVIDAVLNMLNFVVLEDGNKYIINGVEYEFFDIFSKDMKQFGFECNLDDNHFVFLGDEPLDSKNEERVRNSDYVMHEAFCLDKEADIFNPYEKNHSTALSTARVMEELDVKNLILYHTEESHGSDRKKLYTEEAKSVFSGNVIVPNDLEEIQLVKKR